MSVCMNLTRPARAGICISDFLNAQAAMDITLKSERWVREKVKGEWASFVTYVGSEPRIARRPLYRLYGFRDDWYCPECVAREKKSKPWGTNRKEIQPMRQTKRRQYRRHCRDRRPDCNFGMKQPCPR